jgi:hypothetical protein
LEFGIAARDEKVTAQGIAIETFARSRKRYLKISVTSGYKTEEYDVKLSVSRKNPHEIPGQFKLSAISSAFTSLLV